MKLIQTSFNSEQLTQGHLLVRESDLTSLREIAAAAEQAGDVGRLNAARVSIESVAREIADPKQPLSYLVRGLEVPLFVSVLG